MSSNQRNPTQLFTIQEFRNLIKGMEQVQLIHGMVKLSKSPLWLAPYDFDSLDIIDLVAHCAPVVVFEFIEGFSLEGAVESAAYTYDWDYDNEHYTVLSGVTRAALRKLQYLKDYDRQPYRATFSFTHQGLHMQFTREANWYNEAIRMVEEEVAGFFLRRNGNTYIGMAKEGSEAKLLDAGQAQVVLNMIAAGYTPREVCEELRVAESGIIQLLKQSTVAP